LTMGPHGTKRVIIHYFYLFCKEIAD